MTKLQFFEEEIIIHRDHVESTLLVVFFKDEDFIVAYSQTLKISAYGSSLKDALDSFGVCLDEFYYSFGNSFELENELKKLGWNGVIDKQNLPHIEDISHSTLSKPPLKSMSKNFNTQLVYA